MYVLKTECYFTLGAAGPGHLDERRNIFRRPPGLRRARWLRMCCSRCGKKAAFSSRDSGAETTKPGREGNARAGSALVELKAKHAHASRVAQSSGATGRSCPAE
jgi:hypothetical protein